MAVDPASLTLALLAIAGWILLAGAGWSGWIRPRIEIAALAALVLLAFVSHLGLLRTTEAGLALQGPPPHLHEYFHYYLGTKYFSELGHTGLYSAAARADKEDVPSAFQPNATMRDLASNAPVPRREAIETGAAVRDRFSPQRWEAFKGDLRVIRDANPPTLWHSRGYLHDHGYNGTPFVTWILGALGQHGGEARSFINLMRWADPYLLFLLGGTIAVQLGARTGLLFLFFLFANPLYDYLFIGGSYLRSLDLLAVAGAWLALRRGAPKSAGVLLGLATLLRVFPVLFFGGIVGHALLQPDRWARLRTRLPMLVAFVATLLTLGSVSELAVQTPSGRSAWITFAENLSLHASTPTTNDVGWPTLVAYAPAKDHHPGLEGRAKPSPAPPGFDWLKETEKTLAARSGIRVSVTMLLLGLAVFTLRRGRETSTFIPVMLCLFAITAPSHYYWSFLAIAPLATPHRGVQLGLALAYMTFILVFWPGALDTQLDLRFAMQSAALGGFLVASCVALSGSPRRLALGAIALVATLGCGSQPSESEVPSSSSAPTIEAPTSPDATGLGEHAGPRIEGDHFHSATFGFRFNKPSDWHFAPTSSLISDASTRVRDRLELHQRLDSPGLKPIVMVASAAQPVVGRDTLVLLHVIPIRGEEGPLGLELMRKTSLVQILNSFAQARVGPNPNFQVVSPTSVIPFELGEGAQIEMQYDGEAGPTFERLTGFRHSDQFWYLRTIVPHPVTPDDQAWLDEIPKRLQFTP